MLLQLPEFEIHLPNTVREACDLLDTYGRNAHILAGGTDLLVKMKHRRLVPMPRHLINIKTVSGLDSIKCDSHGLHVGALVKNQSIKESALIARRAPLLQAASERLGTTQVRNLGTLGGNLGNASPSAETATVLLVHEASVRCVSSRGERNIPLDRFFVGPGRTALAPGEIITGVDIPYLPDLSGWSYRKHGLRLMDVAIAAASIVIAREKSGRIRARIGLGAVAPKPFRASQTEAFVSEYELTNREFPLEVLDTAAEMAVQETSPIDDLRDLADARRQAVRALVKDGLQEALARSWT